MSTNTQTTEDKGLNAAAAVLQEWFVCPSEIARTAAREVLKAAALEDVVKENERGK